MNPKHDLERRISDYYATEAPSRAPDWLLARALGTIDTTPQRRTGLGPPWRVPTIGSFAKLAVGAAGIVAMMAVGLIVQRPTAVGPAALASSEPSSSMAVQQPPPLTERFDSTSHGIAMDYPAGWQTRPATEPWTSRALAFDDPGADIIFDPTLGEDLYLAMASEAIGRLADHDAWATGVTLPSCPGGHGGTPLTFDGASGWVVQCGGGPALHSAILNTDTRGYAIVLYIGEKGLADTYDWPFFRSVLESLDLSPEVLPGMTNPSPSAMVRPSDVPL